MLPAGSWRPTATAADPLTVGYHLSALYAPLGWLSWARIAALHEQARGADETHRAFVNAVLGETWAESGDSPDWQRLYERREDWPMGTVPAGRAAAGRPVPMCRTTGSRSSIWAWGRGKACWLVEHRVLMGEPGQPRGLAGPVGTAGRELAPCLRRRAEAGGAWASTAALPPRRSMAGCARSPPAGCSRSRASSAARPWSACRPRSTSRAAASGCGAAPRCGPWPPAWPSSSCSTICACRRRSTASRYPPGYVHLPKVDAEYLKQLCAEQLVTRRDRRGYARREWQKTARAQRGARLLRLRPGRRRHPRPRPHGRPALAPTRGRVGCHGASAGASSQLRQPSWHQLQCPYAPSPSRRSGGHAIRGLGTTGGPSTHTPCAQSVAGSAAAEPGPAAAGLSWLADRHAPRHLQPDARGRLSGRSSS